MSDAWMLRRTYSYTGGGRETTLLFEVRSCSLSIIISLIVDQHEPTNVTDVYRDVRIQ